MRKTFGSDTMVIGEADEKLSLLNGVRVRVNDELSLGTIYNVYINKKTQNVQIWVNMDDGGARCFRPKHLTSLNLIKQNILTRLLEFDSN